jgi:hypothetical protein
VVVWPWPVRDPSTSRERHRPRPHCDEKLTHVTGRQRAQRIAVVAMAMLPLVLTGCRTEYHGYDSGIDGVLWRQVTSFEDPLSRSLYRPTVDDNEPSAYLNALEGVRWDGSEASAAGLDLREGGVAIFDVSSTNSSAELSVFIASGQRPDVATEEGLNYVGPSMVFTCYGVTAQFEPMALPAVDRTIFDDCPPALVRLLPEDAAFASAEVFDG